MNFNNTESSDVSAKSIEEISVSIENLGGINDVNLNISRGVSLFVGKNATNRTSLLRSIASVLGGDESAVHRKTDAKHGSIALSIGEETYTRKYEEHGISQAESSPYSEKSTLIDNFVAIDERNPARRAVRNGGQNLGDVLMAPVNTSRIESRIQQKRSERSTLKDRLDKIEEKQQSLPSKYEEKESVEEELSDSKAKISKLQDKIEEYDVSEAAAKKAEEAYEEYNDVRESVETTKSLISRQREKIDSLESKKKSIEDELQDIRVENDKLQEIEEEIEELEDRKRSIKGAIADIESLLDVNEQLLEEGNSEFNWVVDNDVTDALDPSSTTVECWTCGSKVEREEIASRLDVVRDRLSSLRSERQSIDERIAEKRSKTQSIQTDRQQRNKLREDLNEVQAELDTRTDRLDELTETLHDQESQLDELESELDKYEEIENDDLKSAYEELGDAEYRRGRLVEERDRLESEIEDIEKLVEEEKPSIENQIQELTDEIESLRAKIETLENEITETFDTQMNDLLSAMNYGNIARVWLERKVSQGEDQASSFVLHVVRESNDGTVYEDTIDTLSESEREVIGIVVALAGYFVHEVDEQIPFVLLDSVESIDADRLSILFEHIRQEVPFVLAAVLPEEAESIQDEFEQVSADILA